MENGTKTTGGGFKLEHVQPEGATQTETQTGEGDSGAQTVTKKKKKKKGPCERDLNPYRSVSHVRCGGKMEDDVTPCNKKVRGGGLERGGVSRVKGGYIAEGGKIK